ncbi:SUMF1/EgtB/PvdO family nonheme iron enzyme [Adhaeretor mobilis]|uniref:Serine/threonine-protein kinase pkn1 n=1 Tax=Adhaeretor mobilis TaxID=1930276 RepID=A0A517MU51_9BACT|nr:SUMF1/EgtB/PvdO family nonheme iron enzyme [Adhaeretor mobilis]QDS98410.1 Serine/threonine-protein kinase pkn1 [Adhaeretor mobilis]
MNLRLLSDFGLVPIGWMLIGITILVVAGFPLAPTATVGAEVATKTETGESATTEETEAAQEDSQPAVEQGKQADEEPTPEASPAKVKSQTESEEHVLPPGLQKKKPPEGVYVETDHGYMVPYSQMLPGTEVEFEMIPIPGGKFTLGSPETEANRNADEGPQVEVEVPPYWMAKTETTWAEYGEFLRLYNQFKQIETLRSQTQIDPGEKNATMNVLERLPALRDQVASTPSEVDAVTSPTPLYSPDVTYESGNEPDQPAVTMTPYAARQYTKWLSVITEQSYRLPSEVEWEYAARAGSSTAYSHGDKTDNLEDYAWLDSNSDDRSHAVAKKKPNPWGLYDMHGNVAEIVLDEYAQDAYAALKELPEASAEKAIRWPEKQFPRVVRGGSWLDEAPALRSAARFQTDDLEWKVSDPNLPLSPWWYTEIYPAGGVGFRVIRPLEPLTKELQKRAWEIDAEELKAAVEARLEEGRGAFEAIDPKLPEAIEQLDQAEVQKLLN